MILRGDLPACPQRLEIADSAPVAIWREPPRAWLLWLYYQPGMWPELPGFDYGQDVEQFELVDGTWRALGAGGSDWPWRYGERPTSGGPQLSGFATGPARNDGDPGLWVFTGIAPIGATRVALTVEDEEIEGSVEPVSGAFMIGVRLSADRHRARDISDSDMRVVG